MARMLNGLFLAFACVPAALAQMSPPPTFAEGQVICTMEYAPVCAKRGADVRTFGNRCTAEAAGYEIVHSGVCGGASPK
jgi:hypothetical protein